MKVIKRIMIFIFVFASYFVLKEFIELYVYLKNINIYLGYFGLLLIFVFLFYFVGVPVFKIFKIPVVYGPTNKEDEIPKLLAKRIALFRTNRFLLDNGYDFNLVKNDQESYDRIITVLSLECKNKRRMYVNQLFYSTGISQNGFLDALLILSASVNLIKEIFILYNGRVSNRDVWTIAKKVYYSLVIGGSEGAEYAAEEIYSKLATSSMKSIPFLDKIISSLVDGFINASLLTRVSLITENYCKLLYIKSDKDLYPSAKTVVYTTKDITITIVKKINDSLLKIVKDKSENLLIKSTNPVAAVLDKGYEAVKDSFPVKASKNIFDTSVSLIKGIFNQ